jgi:hypothetical protein
MLLNKKKMKHKIFIFLFLTAFFAVQTNAQTTAVGSITGNFSVSPIGAANYVIPIECPDGINGVQPAISLVYNSQSASGIAGWGWHLSGLSAITVGNKTVFSDNAVNAIDLSKKDDYYLDGNKLIVKTGFTYGATNAEYETENKTYVQIKQTASANNYPSKFTVTNKEGVVMEYGQAVKPQGSSYIFQWLLSKVTDNNGNYMTYTYKSSTNGTQTVLDYISYGSNGTTASPLKVQFGYKGKSVKKRQYIAGYYFEDFYLLKNITVTSHSTQLRKYQFTYTSKRNDYQLTEVNLTGINEEQLPATKIE